MSLVFGFVFFKQQNISQERNDNIEKKSPWHSAACTARGDGKGLIQVQPSAPNPSWEPLLTDYNRVVISNEQFAVHIDELCHQFSFQLCICPKPTERYVVYPLISNWKLKDKKTDGMREVEEKRKRPLHEDPYE